MLKENKDVLDVCISIYAMCTLNGLDIEDVLNNYVEIYQQLVAENYCLA